ncbi:MAG: hypothetical protein ACK4OE_21450 [Acidovorax sp.]|uniref:hypothetical protein n=1 Tax=Acidovorax sp. TaxID=1872122 RepID=UPI00391D8D13
MINTQRTISDIFSPQVAGGTSFAVSGDLFNRSHEASHGVIYSSESDFDGLPLWIFPHGDNVEDFFAEVATFYVDILPISAFCHIVEKSIIQDTPKKRPAISNRKVNACIGLSFAEVALRLDRTGASALPTFAACRKSLSFTLSRSYCLYPDIGFTAPYKKWNAANKLLGTQYHPDISEAIHRAFEICFEKAAFPARPKGREAQALKALSGYISDADTENVFVDLLKSVYKSLELVTDKMAGSFDGRMAAFDQIVAVISNSSEGKEIDGIAVGYFASLISPGSFAHLPVLFKLSKKYPTAVIWYGLFSGLNMGRSSSDSVLAIGRKLKRDLQESFCVDSLPQADVSIDELEVLLRLPNLNHSLKPSIPKSLRISLLPGVDIFANFSENHHAAQDDVNEKQLAELQKRQFRARESLIMSLRALDGALEVSESLSKPMNRRNP